MNQSSRFSPMSDREILVSVASDVSLIRDAVFGDGRPGLVETVATHGEALRAIEIDRQRQSPYFDEIVTLREQVQSLGERSLTRSERRGAISLMVTATGMALASVIKAFWGVRLG